jgi:hypothetical protein
MPAEIFSFPFTHSVSIQKESELNHDSAIKCLIEVAETCHCLYLARGEEYFVYWNLGPREDDLNYDMMNIKRKILCLHIDVILDSLKSGQSIHTIGLSSDNQMLHTVITLLEPLDKYNFTIYNGLEGETDCSSSEDVEADETKPADAECSIM